MFFFPLRGWLGGSEPLMENSINFFFKPPLTNCWKKRVSISYWPDINMHCKSSIYSTLFNYNGSFSPFKPKCETISCPFYLYSDSCNSFKPKFEKVLRPVFSLFWQFFEDSHWFWSSFNIFGPFSPQIVGEKFCWRFKGVGKKLEYFELYLPVPNLEAFEGKQRVVSGFLNKINFEHFGPK